MTSLRVHSEGARQDRTRQDKDMKEGTNQARSVEGFRTGPPPDIARW